MYQNVKPEDFVERMIEITVWDFDRIGASEFLGEVRVKYLAARAILNAPWPGQC
jgi:hypothetical protein